MRAGELRHVVKIERPVVTLGTRGERTTTWEVVVAKWRVSIQNTGGREGEAAKRLWADASHVIKGRYIPGVTPECRVVFGTRVFGIGAVDNVDERNVELRLSCAEAVN